jgi:hypothetical protein
VLALSKFGISSLSSVPHEGDGWQLVGQYTALQSISISSPSCCDASRLSPSQWQSLCALRCLTSLSLAAPLHNFSPFTQLTQLTRLEVKLPDKQQVQHADALTHLTRLEELHLDIHLSMSLSMHGSVAHAVGAISSLRRLTLPDVPPGPWTDALARLTGLTQLNTHYLGISRAPHPIHLPSVRVLTTLFVTARQLALITAPQLTRLEAPGCKEPAVSHVGIVCEDAHSDSVRLSASGLLRHCSSVRPHWLWGAPWPSAAESHAVLAALCQSWRPTASAMGSEPASRVWSLMLMEMQFGQAEAALVPAGITQLILWWVQDVQLDWRV